MTADALPDGTPRPDAEALPASAPGAAPLAPVAAGDRLLALDLVRGVALLGILFVNVGAHGLPMAEASAPLDLAGAPPGDKLAWAGVRVLAELKFLSLFSLLFGVGLAVMHERAEAAGRWFEGVAGRRLAVLAALGLAHGLLLWFGDILFVYALVGGVVTLVLPRVRGSLGLVAWAVLAVGVVVGSAMTTAMSQSPHPARGIEADRTLDGMDAMQAASWEPRHPTWIAAEIEAQSRGPGRDAFGFRAFGFGIMTVIAPFAYAWRVLGLMLLGAWLWRTRFFHPARRTWHVRLAMIGVPCGLAMEAASASMRWTGADAGFRAGFASALLHDAGSALLAAGYLGALVVLAHAAPSSRAVGVVAAHGRMPLTTYLSQSVLAGAVFLWWGLGLFGSLARPALLGVAAAIAVVQVGVSAWWMGRFDVGPLEWAWRAATYGRLVPLRRRRS